MFDPHDEFLLVIVTENLKTFQNWWNVHKIHGSYLYTNLDVWYTVVLIKGSIKSSKNLSYVIRFSGEDLNHKSPY